MNRKSIFPLLLVLSLAAAAGADDMKGMKKTGAAPSDAQLIASAMKAAPMSVARNATVINLDEKMNVRTIRKGTNGWTCLPDNPETPGPDPMCMDANAMLWMQAWMGHQAPPPGKVGLMYMLSGGTDASNTDPYATKPTATNHWVKTGPHVMIVGGDQTFIDSYPKNADPDTSAPYVMWSGTPYQHLMVPVK
jgi:hypothetical protein